MFLLYEGVISSRKYKTVTKKSAFRYDNMWRSPIHHKLSLHLSNNYKQSLCWIYLYREVEGSISLKYFLVAMRTLRNSITSSCGLVLPLMCQLVPRHGKVV